MTTLNVHFIKLNKLLCVQRKRVEIELNGRGKTSSGDLVFLEWKVSDRDTLTMFTGVKKRHRERGSCDPGLYRTYWLDVGLPLVL